MSKKINVNLLLGDLKLKGNIESSLFMKVDEGITIMKLLEMPDVSNKLIRKGAYAAIVNGEVHSLHYSLIEDCRCELISYYSTEGYRMYSRTLKFILLMAAKRAFPKGNVKIGNKIGGNFKVELIGIPNNSESVLEILATMDNIVNANLKISKEKITYRKLHKLYHENDMDDQLEFYSLKLHDLYSVNECDGYYNYLYGRLLPSTGYIRSFELELQENGDIILRMPMRNDINNLFDLIESEKIDNSFKEFSIIAKKYGVSTVSKINKYALDELKIKEIISAFETEQRKRLEEIAGEVTKRNSKIIFISGPSSSGKTTLSQKLAKVLKSKGYTAYAISMDDYFFEPDDSPVDKNGKKDFESVYHLDKNFFKEQIISLLKGEDVTIPHYNFKLGGKREFHDENKLKMDEHSILIIEGIHALNPYVSDFLDEKDFYKIYAAPLLTLAYDNYTKVSSNDTRLLRRIVRDSQTRNLSIEKTFEKWAKVKEGEEKNIFPFVNKADYVYNTSLPYEIGVMKLFAENLLLMVPETSTWYSEARRLYSMLQNFRNIFTNYIPKDSIIREFIGSGCFKR